MEPLPSMTTLGHLQSSALPELTGAGRPGATGTGWEEVPEDSLPGNLRMGVTLLLPSDPLQASVLCWEPSGARHSAGKWPCSNSRRWAWLGCPETRGVAAAGSTLPVPCPVCVLEGTAGPCGTAQLLLLGLG